MKIAAEDVWPVVLDFIETHLGDDELEAFKTHFKVTVDHSKDPLVKAGGIQAMLQSFFKSNKKAYKAFMTAKKAKAANSSDSESEEVAVKSKKKKDKKTEKKQSKEAAKADLAGKKRKRSDSQVSDTAGKVNKKRTRTESMNSVKSNGSTGGGPMTRRKSLDAAEAKV